MFHLLLFSPLISLKGDARRKRLSKTNNLLIYYPNSLLMNTSLILMKVSVQSKVFCCPQIISKVSEVLLFCSFTTSCNSQLLLSNYSIPLSKVALINCTFIIFSILVFSFTYLFTFLLKFFFCFY